MEAGFIFAILTGIFYGLQGVYGKFLAGKYPAPVLTWASFTFSIPFLFLFLFFFGIPSVNWQPFLVATSASFIINMIAWTLFFRALAVSPISLTMPFTAFTPLFLIPIAFVMLGELPDLGGMAGIIMVFLGAYGIHLDFSSFLTPFHKMIAEKGTRLMLIVALLWSVSATAEKVAVINSSPEFYALSISSLLSAAYFPYIIKKHGIYVTDLKFNISRFLILGMISGLLVIFQFTALKFLLVSYVISFKRAGVIFSVLLGFFLFREKNLMKNLLFTILMVLGAALIMIR